MATWAPVGLARVLYAVPWAVVTGWTIRKTAVQQTGPRPGHQGDQGDGEQASAGHGQAGQDQGAAGQEDRPPTRPGRDRRPVCHRGPEDDQAGQQRQQPPGGQPPARGPADHAERAGPDLPLGQHRAGGGQQRQADDDQAHPGG
jgi:hypothetical protein